MTTTKYNHNLQHFTTYNHATTTTQKLSYYRTTLGLRQMTQQVKNEWGEVKKKLDDRGKEKTTKVQ